MTQKNETPALVISLLITIGLIGGGFWWFIQRSSFIRPSPQPASDSPADAAIANRDTIAPNFTDVDNVPTGLFPYGGSTTWATIRGTIDPAIQTVFPRFQLRYTNPVSGTPGSTTGIRMLLENQLAFAQSSRAPSPEEYQEAQQRGFTLKEIPVALEGIAIAVNPNLNLPGLTLEQLKGIYRGQITNWRQVGGADLPITPYSRRVEDSATVEFWIDNVLNGENFGNTVRLVGTTTEALRQVSNNLGGIYFASAPEIVGQCTTRPLPIGRSANELIPPYQEPLVPAGQCPARRNQMNEAALQSGQYPITRSLFVIVKQNGQIDQQAGEAYANLLLTDQGQSLLVKAGFVRIR